MYGEYDGTRVVVDGEDYQVLEDRNILLIYEGDKPTITNARLLEDRVAIRLNPPLQETLRGVLIAESAKQNWVPQDGQVRSTFPLALAFSFAQCQTSFDRVAGCRRRARAAKWPR